MTTSGGSSRVEQPVIQLGDGSSILTSPLHYLVTPCKFKDIRGIFESYHYKGSHIGGGISVCLALYCGVVIIGGAVVGKPRHEKKYGEKVLEIRRMALLDIAPKNSESFFLSRIIRHIRINQMADTVLSYADQSVGHTGTIYRAANFHLAGYTSPSLHVFWNGTRYHPRSLTIDRPYSYRLREAVRNGKAAVERGEPKAIYIYEITNRRKKEDKTHGKV